MLRVVLFSVLVLVVVNAAAHAAVGGVGQLVGLLLGWLVAGYLLWRAWPAVRSDLGRLPRRLFGRRSRRGASGGLL